MEKVRLSSPRRLFKDILWCVSDNHQPSFNGRFCSCYRTPCAAVIVVTLQINKDQHVWCERTSSFVPLTLIWLFLYPIASSDTYIAKFAARELRRLSNKAYKKQVIETGHPGQPVAAVGNPGRHLVTTSAQQRWWEDTWGASADTDLQRGASEAVLPVNTGPGPQQLLHGRRAAGGCGCRQFILQGHGHAGSFGQQRPGSSPGTGRSDGPPGDAWAGLEACVFCVCGGLLRAVWSEWRRLRVAVRRLLLTPCAAARSVRSAAAPAGSSEPLQVRSWRCVSRLARALNGWRHSCIRRVVRMHETCLESRSSSLCFLLLLLFFLVFFVYLLFSLHLLLLPPTSSYSSSSSTSSYSCSSSSTSSCSSTSSSSCPCFSSSSGSAGRRGTPAPPHPPPMWTKYNFDCLVWLQLIWNVDPWNRS